EKDNFLPEFQPQVTFGTATAQYKLKKYPEAAETYDHYLKQFPKSTSRPLAAFMRLVARMNINLANLDADCPPYLKEFPESQFVPTVEFFYAGRLSGTQQYGKALPYWKKLALMAQLPENIPANIVSFEYAVALERERQWIQAAEMFDQ